MKKPPASSLLLLVERALANSVDLTIGERVHLLDAVAYVAPSKEISKAASDEAFHLREAERSQLQLAALFREGGAQS